MWDQLAQLHLERLVFLKKLMNICITTFFIGRIIGLCLRKGMGIYLDWILYVFIQNKEAMVKIQILHVVL